MAMGTRKHRQRQEQLWVTHAELATGPGHPFYTRLNELLDQEKFDEFAEAECAQFYAENNGRRSLPPGTYFRLLLIGYFEGIDSERGIAWRGRRFVGLASVSAHRSGRGHARSLHDFENPQADRCGNTPQGVPVGTGSIGGSGPAERQDCGRGRDDTGSQCGYAVDRAAGQRSQLRGVSQGLAQQSGIETASREDLARVDRKKEKKASNEEWMSPSDPDARIAKMKDGTTHLAHKAHHAVDMETGAVIAVTLQAADQGDTTTIKETLAETAENV